MKVLKLLGHALLSILCLALLLGVPFSRTDYFKGLLTGNTDAVSSATGLIDAPSGSYIVLINNSLHTPEKLSEWTEFFTGGDYSYIMEDISCSVSESDPGALNMAESFQSKLSKKQMPIESANGTLLLSRADAGLFDIIIMSTEYAEANSASSAYSGDVTVLYVGGEEA